MRKRAKPTDWQPGTKGTGAEKFYARLDAAQKLRAEKLASGIRRASDRLFHLCGLGDDHAGHSLVEVLTYFDQVWHFVRLHLPDLAEPIEESKLGWPRVFSSRLKYANQSVATGIAVRLVFDLMSLTSEDPIKRSESFTRYLKRIGLKRMGQIREQVRSLGPFCKRNARAFARAAKPFFVAQYGKNFDRHRAFAQYREKSRGDATIEGQREKLYPRPGDLRNAIWKDVMQGFQTIAPKAA